MIDRPTSVTSANPSTQLALGGSFVPHGYPCFTLSATFFVELSESILVQHLYYTLNIEKASYNQTINLCQHIFTS